MVHVGRTQHACRGKVVEIEVSNCIYCGGKGFVYVSPPRGSCGRTYEDNLIPCEDCWSGISFRRLVGRQNRKEAQGDDMTDKAGEIDEGSR